MKNILFLIESLKDGGSEKSISKVANEISKKHNVFLVLASSKNNDYIFNGKIFEIQELKNKNPLIRLKGIKKLKKFKKNNNIDISISYLTAYNLYNVLSKYKDKVFISIRNHLSTKKEGFIPYLGTLISNKKADKIICCSESVSEDQINNFKANKNKIRVIENYIDEIRDNKTSKKNIIITIGRLTKHKGQEHIIKAMSIVTKKIPNAQLLILGRGPQESYLLSLIKKLKLESNIELIGFTTSIEDYLKKSKVFVLASDYEGFSNALLEAMSYSIPVIATSSPGGNNEVLSNKTYKKEIKKSIHEKYGILIPSFIKEHGMNEITKNEKILAKEIINILINKKDYNYYNNKSKERASNYNKENIIGKWFSIIEEDE